MNINDKDLVYYYAETVLDEYIDLMYRRPIHPLAQSFDEFKNELGGKDDDEERLLFFVKSLFSFAFEIFFELEESKKEGVE